MSACVASMWTWVQVHSVHVNSQTLQVMPEISDISGEPHRQMDPKSSLASLHSPTAAFRLVRGPVLQEGIETGSHLKSYSCFQEEAQAPTLSHAWTTHTSRYIKGRKGKYFNQYANKCQQVGLASKNIHHIKARVQSGDPQNEGEEQLHQDFLWLPYLPWHACALYTLRHTSLIPVSAMACVCPHVHSDTHAQNKLKF